MNWEKFQEEIFKISGLINLTTEEEVGRKPQEELWLKFTRGHQISHAMPRISVTPTASIKSIDLKNIQRRLLDSKMKTISPEAFCGS